MTRSRVLESRELVVARLEANRSERVGILEVDRPLRHEGLGDRDPGGVDPGSERPAGVRPDHPVPNERDRMLGRVDQLGRPFELLAAGLRLDGLSPWKGRGVQGERHDVLWELEVGGSRLL